MAFTIANGMATSVFNDKYARFVDGRYESWSDVARRVSKGNSLFEPEETRAKFSADLYNFMSEGYIGTSGRHLQHGDENQLTARGDRFVNCATSFVSHLKFWMLMQGAGVGRVYSNSLCVVNWDNMPNFRVVLDRSHPDYENWIEPLDQAVHIYSSESETVRWFEVEDSAEGWAKVVEVLETAAYQTTHKDKLFIFDMSKVRAKGQPVRGMQNRPSSGPIPLIKALHSVHRIKGAGLRPWKQALIIDHLLSEAVLSGGVRRSARIACKPWTDSESDVIDFITCKAGGAYFWSANNSVLVDETFWNDVKSNKSCKARRIYDAMIAACYYDNTGEPGFINVDKLTQKNTGLENITSANFLNKKIADKLAIHPKTYALYDRLLLEAKSSKYHMLVNPCAEISLAIWGAYCTIGDIILANLPRDIKVAKQVAITTAKFLINVNKMDFLYDAEVKRTNRIGIGLTGIHEFAWYKFGLRFSDLIDETKSKEFWDFISEMRVAVEEFLQEEKRRNPNFVIPHTVFTIKPSGTISKAFSVTEGAHRPAYPGYIRWVQLVKDSPKVAEYISKGYLFKDVSSVFSNTVVIGFPTLNKLCEDMYAEDPSKSTECAGELDMASQYTWVSLLEKHWLGTEYPNQVSYTLKYKPSETSYEKFRSAIQTHQPSIRCCSVMPQVDQSAYIYTPEEEITIGEYYRLMSKIEPEVSVEMEYDPSTLECAGGACPIELNIR